MREQFSFFFHVLHGVLCATCQALYPALSFRPGAPAGAPGSVRTLATPRDTPGDKNRAHRAIITIWTYLEQKQGDIC